MINVYAWPCVGVLGREWTLAAPVNRSGSMFSDADYISAAQRRRRVAELRVSARSAGNQGAGYMEALKELLWVGENISVHAVRLYSFPINHRDPVGLKPPVLAEELGWRTVPPDEDLGWEAPPDTLRWFTGAYYSASAAEFTPTFTNNGMGRGDVTGLPVSQPVANVGSHCTVFNKDGTAFETRRLLRSVRGDSSGEASIWTTEPFTLEGKIEFNSRDTGVFRLQGAPRNLKPSTPADHEIACSFREVFADECGGFNEIPNLWG